MNKEIETNFYEKRREGLNDDYLCELIRNNEIQEFIRFTEQRNLSLEICIKKSIFETNRLLTDKSDIKLIEYASFYGSNDIIKYIEKKGVELTSSMWIYAIHSCNAELIRYLEDNHVSPPDNDYERILEESIKCHHNDISNYLIDNIMNEEYTISRWATRFSKCSKTLRSSMETAMYASNCAGWSRCSTWRCRFWAA